MVALAAMSREFKCIDCGWHVVSFGEPQANDQDLCCQCQWLRDVKDDGVREELRRRLQRRHG